MLNCLFVCVVCLYLLLHHDGYIYCFSYFYSNIVVVQRRSCACVGFFYSSGTYFANRGFSMEIALEHAYKLAKRQHQTSRHTVIKLTDPTYKRYIFVCGSSTQKVGILKGPYTKASNQIALLMIASYSVSILHLVELILHI